MICFRCGFCCTTCQVRLSLIEARRIRDSLGQSWDEFVSKYLDYYWPEVDSFLLRSNHGKCVFLGKLEGGNMRRCLIHPVKPSACTEWNVSLYRSECREGLSRFWSLAVGSSGKIRGPDSKLQEFKTFVESLASACDQGNYFD